MAAQRRVLPRAMLLTRRRAIRHFQPRPPLILLPPAPRAMICHTLFFDRSHVAMPVRFRYHAIIAAISLPCRRRLRRLFCCRYVATLAMPCRHIREGERFMPSRFSYFDMRGEMRADYTPLAIYYVYAMLRRLRDDDIENANE